MGFGLPSNGARRDPVWTLACQRCRQSLLDELAAAGHRRRMDLHRAGHGRIDPGRATFPLIGLEHDAGAGEHPGWCNTRSDERAQSGAFGCRERHAILGLAHAGPLLVRTGRVSHAASLALAPHSSRDGLLDGIGFRTSTERRLF